MTPLHIASKIHLDHAKGEAMAWDFQRGYELCDIREEFAFLAHELYCAGILDNESILIKVEDIKELLDFE